MLMIIKQVHLGVNLIFSSKDYTTISLEIQRKEERKKEREREREKSRTKQYGGRRISQA